MRTLITGAAGSGTSTLAAALARDWNAAAIEVDAFFWLPTDPPYQQRRDHVSRRALLEQELLAHPRAVAAGSVMGWGLDALFDLVVFLYADAAVRIPRLQAREVARFGKADPEFLLWAAQYDEGPPEGRSLAKHEAWLRTLRCPVVRLVGDQSTAQQIALIRDAVPHLKEPG
ncbi:MAG: hypothetical protein V4864_12280 [Pseudomonadota bacterium]